MNRYLLGRIALAGALLAAWPASAIALPATSPGTQAQALSNLKAKGTTEIERRLANLAAAQDKLAQASKVAASDKTALTKQISDTAAGLTNLKTKLAAETTVAAARADVASMVTDYRVYALMLPKARLVAMFDRVEVANGKLGEVATKLETAAQAAKTSGKDTSAIDAKLSDAKAKQASAQQKISGRVTSLLALAPSDVNRDRKILADYRTAAAGAVTDLKAARDDLRAAADLLKTLK